MMKSVKQGMNVPWSFLSIFILLFMGGCSEPLLDEVDDGLLKSASQTENDWAVYSAWDGEIAACETYTLCLVAGQHIDAGTLDFSYDNEGNIYITYNTKDGWYLTEIHLDLVHELADIPTNKNDHPKIGQFPYQVIFDAADMTSSHTVMIENPHIGTEYQYGCFPVVLAAHAVVVKDSEGEETAWATFCDESSQRFVNQGTWATYVSGDICIQPCEADYSFAWEDLLNVGNDRDYNDLVVQAIVWKEMDESIKTYMKFIAKARGAGYDHTFWIDLGGGDIRTIFQSTQMALPGGYQGWGYNTVDPCYPLPYAETAIMVDGDLTGTGPFPPFIPMITVFPSGSYLNPAGSYDLNIWELAEADTPGSGNTYVTDGLTYPNGLLIPSDWKWPLEFTNINMSYEDFMDISNWNDQWYLNLSDPTMVWDPPNAICP